MSILYPDLPLTTFPNSLDEFIDFANISQSDAPLVKSYQEAIQSGNFGLAQTILNSIPDATQKIITAQTMNKLAQSILACERFFNDDIESYLATQRAEWQAIIDQLAYIDEYDPLVQYEKNNMVYSVSDGSNLLYICIATPPTVGIAPTNMDYWRQFTIKGRDGATGAGMVFTGAWSNSTPYVVDNIAVFASQWWGALLPSTNEEPYEGSIYWESLLDNTPTKYPVQSTEPTTQSEGELWLKLL